MRTMTIRVPCKRKIKCGNNWTKHFRTLKQYTNALIYLTRQRFIFSFAFRSLFRCQLVSTKWMDFIFIVHGWHTSNLWQCISNFTRWGYHSWTCWKHELLFLFYLSFFVVGLPFYFLNYLIADLRWICRRFKCVSLFVCLCHERDVRLTASKQQ